MENNTVCSCQSGWVCPPCADKLKDEIYTLKQSILFYDDADTASQSRKALSRMIELAAPTSR